MEHNIHSLAAQGHTPPVACKRWLRMALDRLEIQHKAMAIHLGVDDGTLSRWCSDSHPQTIPLAAVIRALGMLDQVALDDLIAMLRGGAQ